MDALDLDVRIRAAFEAGAVSQDIATLIGAVEQAARTADRVAEAARGRALDPALASNGMKEARREMEDAAFERDRLHVAATKLKTRLDVVRGDEEDARRLEAYEAIEGECDVLAAELKSFYPEMAGRLADLLARIAANDEKIEHINRHGLPRRRSRLLSAELIARGLDGWVQNGSALATRLTDEVRLPRWHLQSGAGGALLWPRTR